MTTRSTTQIRTPPQSGYKVEQGNRNPGLNPYVCVNSFDPLEVEGLGGIVETLNDANTAYMSRLSREKVGEYTPPGMGKTDCGRSVYPSSRDVTVSGSTQEVSGRGADCDYKKAENDGYLQVFNSDDTPDVINKTCGDTFDRTEIFSKGLLDKKIEFNVKVLDPLYSFTTEEGVIVKVYDECRQGICSCNYQLSGERLRLKPCRFAYLVSLGTAECKKAYEPLVSNIKDGFKVVDDNMDLSNMHYECDNYSSVYTTKNKAKLDNIIGKELSEGYLKIVNSKPTCIHSMGAVPKPDGGD